MIDENKKCQNAEPFFYEYFHGSTETLPEDVLDHIENCSLCLDSIASMKDIFEQSDDALPTNSRHAILAGKLGRHFSFMDKPVTCSCAKAFMAEMADPIMRITVPTPITVHIQHCEKCAKDVDTIKSFHYHGEALAVIGDFLSQKPSDEISDVSKGLLNGILTRADSQIVTIFNIDRSVDLANLATEKQQTGQWPITVQVLQKDSMAPSQAEHPLQKRTIPFFRTGIAAAIIIFAFILFPGTAPSMGVSLAQMYQALNKMENFHMVAVSPDTGNVIQEKWIANSLGLMLIEQQGHSVLWNINTATMKTEDLQIKQLNKEAVLGIKKTMEPSVNLLPFPYLSQVPEQADWNKIELTDKDVGISDTEIYDLVWTEDTSFGQKITNRSRCYIDIQSRVPRRTELWQKEDGEFKLHSIFEISYPSSAEINKTITAKGI